MPFRTARKASVIRHLTMALETYNKKRDFKKTPEPPGKKPRKKRGHSFVIQKHARGDCIMTFASSWTECY